MGLRKEIAPYLDGFGLVAPNKVAPGQMQGSDNGTMFTSEYYIMLTNHNPWTPGRVFDQLALLAVISPCTVGTKYGLLLNRTPDNRADQDSIDNYLAVTAACKALNITVLPRLFLNALWRGRGWMNNVNPGVKTRESFLLRFPQLIAAFIAAAYPSKLLKHRAIRALAFPLFAYAAISLLFAAATSKRGEPDKWRLAWLLLQAVSPVSYLCDIAGGIWYRKLLNTYPEATPGTAMRCVAKEYYEPGHPFIKYWID